MSYEIIYDKQFIKTSKGFIPMVSSGSNNCYEHSSGSRMRRTRSWFSWNIGGIISTEEQLMDYVNQTRQSLIDSNNRYLENHPDWDIYDDKRFGYFSSIAIGGNGTRGTTFGNFKGLFRIGIDNAMTVEELVAMDISVWLHTSTYDDASNKEKGIEPVSFYPKTTKELEDFVTEMEDKVRLLVSYNHSGDYVTNRLQYMRRVKRQDTVKKETTVTEGFAIVLESGAYFWKFTKRGYIYSYSSPKLFYKKTNLNSALRKVKNRILGEAKIETVKLHTPIKI